VAFLEGKQLVIGEKRMDRVNKLITLVSKDSAIKVKKGRLRELQCIFYFLPDNFDGVDKTPDAKYKEEYLFVDNRVDSLLNYFNTVERGVNSLNVSNVKVSNLLFQANRWRGIHMTMYQEGVLSGDMPYSVILEGVSLVVAKYLAGNLFRGVDRDLIMSVWEEVNDR